MSRSSGPTVADVARAAGVGAITVSRYVNGASYVSADKQKRIQAAIRKLGYRPNQAARILKGQRARTIGLILPDLADPFFGKCASAVEDLAAKHGYTTLILTSKRDPARQEKELAMLLGQQVAGLLVVSSLPSKGLRQFSEANIPIVALDLPLPGSLADEVVVENRGGSRTAVEHLIAHGRKRIACVGYDSATYAISQRILGYMDAMRAARLRQEVYDALDTQQAAVSLVAQWKKAAARPGAIFSLNSVTSRHLLHALQEAELSVPQKMAIVGFDDLELASLLKPGLTVIRQPATELGTQAVRLLFERINPASPIESRFGIKLVLPVEFVIRGSCGCLPEPR